MSKKDKILNNLEENTPFEEAQNPPTQATSPPLQNQRTGFRNAIKFIGPALLISATGIPQHQARAQQATESKSSPNLPQCNEGFDFEKDTIKIESVEGEGECRYINALVNLGSIYLAEKSAVEISIERVKIRLMRGRLLYNPPKSGQIPELKVEVLEISSKGWVEIRKLRDNVEVGSRHDGLKIITPQGFYEMNEGDWSVYENNGKLVAEGDSADENYQKVPENAIGCQILGDGNKIPDNQLPILLILAYLIANRSRRKIEEK